MPSKSDDNTGEDAVVAKFLSLLDRDLATHPERLQGMPHALYQRLLEVTEGIVISLDDPIEGDVAL